ncbi:MAG: roadblock/LC7 domain-containing protein [Candidatus Thorarchaeota archaeon]
MSNDQNPIPPVQKIQDRLIDFSSRVSVWGVMVFTIDGYVIAHHSSGQIPEGIEMAISSMSAGLITIAEDFIRMIDAAKVFKDVLVDSVDDSGGPSFSVLLGNIADNVLIACIFPRTTQLGLLTFEIENLRKEIREVISEWDVKLHSETLT